MITAKEREASFRNDFAELLAKHKAEIRITDDGKPWGMHTGICEVSMFNEFDADGNELAEYTEFRL